MHEPRMYEPRIGYMVIRQESSAVTYVFRVIYPSERDAEDAITNDLPEWPWLSREDYTIATCEVWIGAPAWVQTTT